MMPETEMAPPDAVLDGFRTAMSQLAAGVVMVTCRVGGKPWGLTVSACCSVSMSPPLLLVSLGSATTSTRAIQDSGEFGVSLLGQSLIDVARFGSAPGQPKFVERLLPRRRRLLLQPGRGRSAGPRRLRARAPRPCRRSRPADRRGTQRRRHRRRERGPLVYHRRSYHQLGASTDLDLGPEPDEETIDSLLYDYPMPRRFARVVSLGA